METVWGGTEAGGVELATMEEPEDSGVVGVPSTHLASFSERCI